MKESYFRDYGFLHHTHAVCSFRFVFDNRECKELSLKTNAVLTFKILFSFFGSSWDKEKRRKKEVQRML